MSEPAPTPDDSNALTVREREVLHWVAEGKSNFEIACILSCAEETVKKHVHHIYQKLGVENRTCAAIAYLQTSM